MLFQPYLTPSWKQSVKRTEEYGEKIAVLRCTIGIRGEEPEAEDQEELTELVKKLNQETKIQHQIAVALPPKSQKQLGECLLESQKIVGESISIHQELDTEKRLQLVESQKQIKKYKKELRALEEL